MPRHTERTGPLTEEEILQAAAMAGFMADKRAAGFLLRLIGEVRRHRLGRRMGRAGRKEAAKAAVDLNETIKAGRKR